MPHAVNKDSPQFPDVVFSVSEIRVLQQRSQVLQELARYHAGQRRGAELAGDTSTAEYHHRREDELMKCASAIRARDLKER